MKCLFKLCIISLLLGLLCLYIYVKKEKFDKLINEKFNDETQTPTNDVSFFNNEDLREISKYAIDKYISVPNDASVTNFYKLGFDENYNIIPKITMY